MSKKYLFQIWSMVFNFFLIKLKYNLGNPRMFALLYWYCVKITPFSFYSEPSGGGGGCKAYCIFNLSTSVYLASVISTQVNIRCQETVTVCMMDIPRRSHSCNLLHERRRHLYIKLCKSESIHS